MKRFPKTVRPEFEQMEARLVPSIVPLSSPINVATGPGGQSVTTHRTAGEEANGAQKSDDLSARPPDPRI